jgi:hypothetical protein
METPGRAGGHRNDDDWGAVLAGPRRQPAARAHPRASMHAPPAHLGLLAGRPARRRHGGWGASTTTSTCSSKGNDRAELDRGAACRPATLLLPPLLLLLLRRWRRLLLCLPLALSAAPAPAPAARPAAAAGWRAVGGRARRCRAGCQYQPGTCWMALAPPPPPWPGASAGRLRSPRGTAARCVARWSHPAPAEEGWRPAQPQATSASADGGARCRPAPSPPPVQSTPPSPPSAAGLRARWWRAKLPRRGWPGRPPARHPPPGAGFFTSAPIRLAGPRG